MQDEPISAKVTRAIDSIVNSMEPRLYGTITRITLTPDHVIVTEAIDPHEFYNCPSKDDIDA